MCKPPLWHQTVCPKGIFNVIFVNCHRYSQQHMLRLSHNYSIQFLKDKIFQKSWSQNNHSQDLCHILSHCLDEQRSAGIELHVIIRMCIMNETAQKIKDFQKVWSNNFNISLTGFWWKVHQYTLWTLSPPQGTNLEYINTISRVRS